jgi:hypothetical protein
VATRVAQKNIDKNSPYSLAISMAIAMHQYRTAHIAQ